MSGQDTIILVVDAEEKIRDSARAILAPEDLVCRGVASGSEALEVIPDLQPGVVLLATRLPSSSGLEMVVRIRRESPGCRVIMLADAGDHDAILDALEKGASDYLAKPLHPRETRLAVRRALETWRSDCQTNDLRLSLELLVAGSERLVAQLADVGVEERDALIAQGTVDQAALLLGAGKVSLMMLDAPGHWLRVEACTGHSLVPAEMDVVLPGEGPAGFALSTGTSFAVADARRDPRFRDMLVPDRYQGHSFMLVPLMAQGRACGVLCASESSSGSPFGDGQLILLRLIAQRFVEARLLVRSSLARGRDGSKPIAEVPGSPAGGWLDTLEVLPKESDFDFGLDAEIAREICHAVSDEIDPDRMLKAALGSLARSLAADPVTLYLADPNSGRLKREGAYQAGPTDDRTDLPLGRGLVDRVLSRGEVLVVPDPESEADFDAQVDTPLDGIPRSILCMPVEVRGKVIGMVRAFLPREASVSSRTGEIAGAALSAAVRNVLLYRNLVSSIEEIAAARRAARA